MIKGLVITPPIVGRISIGKVVVRNDRRLPEKDDQFTITKQVQTQEGWILHPKDAELRKNTANGKLRTIPVTMLFNDPNLNFRAEYSLFDRSSGRPLCVGNGETCKRVGAKSIEKMDCPSPDICPLGRGACKPYGRLNVKIGDDDEMGTFVFRTTGFNSIRTLTARLSYYKAVSGNALACMPLELRLRSKSTTQSYRTPIYYVDLCVRAGKTLEEAISEAKALDAQRKAAGFDQEALEAAAYEGFGNGSFEESSEDVPEILEEFYPEGNDAADQAATVRTLPQQSKPSLKEKLDQKVTLNGAV